MTGMNRMRFFAAAGFALVCVVILGGLVWSTWLTVRLDRHETRAAREEEFQAALWRLDNWFMPQLAQESGRSYLHYSAFYTPSSLFRSDGAEVEPTAYQLPSPILEQPIRPWIRVYFQVIAPDRWTSPQIPPGPAPPGWENLADGDRLAQVHTCLDSLRNSLSLELLQERFAQAELLDAAVEGQSALPAFSPAARGAPRGLERYTTAWQRGLEEVQQRMAINRAMQQQSTPIVGCEPAQVVSQTVFSPATSDVESDFDPWPSFSESAGGLEVRVSALHACWFMLPDTMEETLVFLRRVTFRGDSGETAAYQGFVADWKLLSAELLRQIGPTYRGTALKPVFGPRDPRSHHNMLATLPATLEVAPQEVSASLLQWNEARATLLMVWILAIVALGIIGFGLRTLLAVSHRRVEFAYAVAHELRTPLTTFRLYTDMLAEGLVPEESRQEYFQTLNRESKRLAELVNSVLEYARVENRKVRLNPRTVSAAQFLDHARSTFARACEDEGVELVLDNRWKDDRPLRTDIDLVLCVAGVLVANACRHGRNGASSRVVLRLGEEHQRINVDVIDNGPGIEAADARSLYRPFRRGKTAESKAKGGLGLGLALARNWCRLLGGRLELVARKDPTLGGAHFRLTLPQLEGNGIAA